MQRNESTTRAVRTAGARNTTNLALAALAVVAGMALASTAHAAVKTWDGGGVNTLFATAANWDSDVAPVNGDDATIGGTYAATIEANLPSTLLSLTIGSDASLTNVKTGGSYQLTANSLTNNGTIDVNGTSTTQLTTKTGVDNVTNTGLIKATTGTFQFQGGNIANTGGTIQALSGGTIRAKSTKTFTGGNLTIDNGGTFIGSGNAEVFTLSGVTTTLNGTLINGAISSSGENSGRKKILIIDGGTFSVGATGILDARSNDASSPLNLQGTEKVQVMTGTTFSTVAGGQINLENNNNYNVTNPTNNKAGAASFVVDSGATFNNAGTMNLTNVSTSTNTGTGSAQTTLLQIDTAAASFSNTGTINLSDASTAAAGHSTKITAASGLTNAGTISAANSTSSVVVTGAYSQTAGSTRLNTGSSLTASTGIAVTDGFLQGDTGTFTATTGGISITSNGQVAPGSAGIGTVGTLNFGGATTFGNGSNLNIDLLGDTFDVLAITGNIDLSSSSDNVTFAATGTQTLSRYVFATYTGSLSGTFNSVVNLPTGYVMDYGTSGQIALNVVPEPTSLAALGLFGLAAMRRRRMA